MAAVVAVAIAEDDAKSGDDGAKRVKVKSKQHYFDGVMIALDAFDDDENEDVHHCHHQHYCCCLIAETVMNVAELDWKKEIQNEEVGVVVPRMNSFLSLNLAMMRMD